MGIETQETYYILLEDGNVIRRTVRVNERLVTTHESAKMPLEAFRKAYPKVKIRNFSEDVEINLAKVPVAKLAQVLSEVNDKALIQKWMREDERATAAQHYIKRLEEFGDNSGDDGSAG